MSNFNQCGEETSSDMTVSKNILRLNVSGNYFELEKSKVLQYGNTLLGTLASKQNYGKANDDGQVLHFHRSVDAFKEVLAFYQTGELHMPTNMCPKAFIRELAFWGLDQNLLEKCCKFKLLSYLDSFETASCFQEVLVATKKRSKDEIELKKLSLRSRIWAVIDNREDTIWAKVFMLVAIFFVLLSIFNLAISTLPTFNKHLTACELRNYMMSRGDEIDEDILDFLDTIECHKFAYDEWENAYEHYEYSNSDTNQDNSTNNPNNWQNNGWPSSEEQKGRFAKIKLPKVQTRSLVCEYIDYVALSFFTAELVVRIMCSPSLIGYFKSFLNCIDLIALLSTYVYLLISHVQVHLKYDSTLMKILLNIQAFRALRIMRVVQNVGVIMVLLHSMRSSLKELLILLMYMFIVVNLFANFLYLAEKEAMITSVPQAWYWGIVTMTTLGYGDLYPKSLYGRVVACFCAISGIILIALVIPVVVNNFMTLYQVAILSDRMEEKREKGVPKKDEKPKDPSLDTISYPIYKVAPYSEKTMKC